MSQIVVGVDESDGAALALRWALRQSAIRDWSIEAVMAWGLHDQSPKMSTDQSDPDGDGDALAALEAIVTAAVGADAASVELRTIREAPGRALLDAAHGSELLVVGARGLGGFRSLLLGSVSQHCLHHATSPVAIVRGEPERSEGQRERIIAPVDGSEDSQRALRWALDEARARKADLHVVNAWDLPAIRGYAYGAMVLDPAMFAEMSRQVLDEAVGALDLGEGDVSVERISASGGTAWVILQAAEQADLVVMGSRGLGGFKGMILGSVTHQVSHHAACPVVVIPPNPS